MKINLEELNKRVEQGLINVQTEGDLSIYKYSKECVYSKSWDEYTRMCRGLVLDKEGNIIARPFKKFFNIDEMEEVSMSNLLKKDVTKVEMSTKMDGSLGIVFEYKDEICLVTSGSFDSEQAIKGKEILNKKYKDKLKDVFKRYSMHGSSATLLFEIIYPENRIVVDYEGMEDLVLIGVVDNDTGTEYTYNFVSILGQDYGIPVCYNSEVNLQHVLERVKLNTPNTEGYVLRFNDGTRVKVKTEEYVRLHRIVTGLSEKRIWEYLKTGSSIQELMSNLPEEFKQYIEKVSCELRRKYVLLENEAKLFIADMPMFYTSTRKEKAAIIKNSSYPINKVLFAMLDEKDYSQMIWDYIKPKHVEEYKGELV